METKPLTRQRRRAPTTTTARPPAPRKPTVLNRYLNPPGVTPGDDSDEAWRLRITAGPRVTLTGLTDTRGKKVPLQPDDLLSMDQIAEYLTKLTGRPTPYAGNTIRTYKRAGILPVPDEQVGGHHPGPGELIPWTGRLGNSGKKPSGNARRPRPGELIGCTEVRWHAWKVLRWQAHRPGRGWHASGEERRRYIDRGPGVPGWTVMPT